MLTKGLKIVQNRFGLLSDGTKVHLYTLSNGKMSVSVCDYGCIITSIVIPDKKHKRLLDVSLGSSTLDGWVLNHETFGAVVGRFANRIGGASFTLDGVKYELDKNDNKANTLHGGFERWDKKVWKAKRIANEYGIGVKLTRKSPDGEQGFPGNAKVSVSYLLNDRNDLTIVYKATSDKATPFNMTNHSYFNLNGHSSGNITGHTLQMNCSQYLEVDKELIPTGKKIDVAGGPFDFRTEKTIGADMSKVGVGYDHCYCLDGFTGDGSLKTICVLGSDDGSRRMTVRGTQPGIQLYTGNFLNNINGKDGAVYQCHDAVCLETQDFPDAPNKDSFPQSILRPGNTYRQVTQYSFMF